MANADDDDKTEEPTARKLEEARRKGDVIYSMEATAWVGLAAIAAVAAFLAEPIARSVADVALPFLTNAHDFPADGGALQRLFLTIGISSFGAVLGVGVMMSVGAALSRYVQDQPVFTAERLKPSFNKINPIEGAKRLFGMESLVNFAKSAAKLALVGGVALWILWPRDATYVEAGALDPVVLLTAAQDKVIVLVCAVLAAFTAIAIGDYLYTRYSYIKRNRMSRQELKDEYKQTEGDPMVKGRLRQIRMERARKRMMAAVPGASVVVTNPTHYAVALKYDDTTPAPVCVAKGVDATALRIREIAEEAGVPVIEDPPLARALYAAAELDRQIPRAQYEAVARIIGLVQSLARNRRGPQSRPNQP